jgi:putative ATP-dependent endonuclease of the OLD family
LTASQSRQQIPLWLRKACAALKALCDPPPLPPLAPAALPEADEEEQQELLIDPPS